MNEWKKHFMNVLEGAEKETDKGRGREEEKKKEADKEKIEKNDRKINETEVKAQVKKLKKGKVIGEDRINNEAWIQ